MKRGLQTAGRAVLAAGALLVGAGVGCNTDRAAPTDLASDPPASAPVAEVKQASTTDIFTTLGITKPKYSEFLYSSVKDPWTANTAAACNAYDTRYPTLRSCICSNCMNLIHQCDALAGCKEIFQCALDKGCRTPNACYLAPTDGTGCIAQIDKWGTGSVSTALTQELGACMTTANCPTAEM